MASSWKRFLIPGVLLLILASLPLLVQMGTDTMNLLVMLFIYIILAQSWNLIGGYAGQINLGLAAFFGCGVLVTHFAWAAETPIYVAVLAGSLATVAMALIIGIPTLRLRGMYFASGTLALAEALRIAIGNIFPRSVYMPSSYAVTYSHLPRYYLALVGVVFTLVTIYLATNSKLGLAMVALRDDEEAAQVTGVNTFKYKVFALVISAFLAGLAGGVYAFFRMSLLPSSAFAPLWTFEPLMAAAIGGAGTFVGPIAGSFFLLVLQELFALNLGEAHLIIFGILFIVVVLYFPTGLVGALYPVRRALVHVAGRKPQVGGRGQAPSLPL